MEAPSESLGIFASVGGRQFASTNVTAFAMVFVRAAAGGGEVRASQAAIVVISSQVQAPGRVVGATIRSPKGFI